MGLLFTLSINGQGYDPITHIFDIDYFNPDNQLNLSQLTLDQFRLYLSETESNINTPNPSLLHHLWKGCETTYIKITTPKIQKI